MADDEIDDDDEVDDDDEDGEGEGDGEKSKGGSKKLLIIVGLVVFLVIGAGAAVFFTGARYIICCKIGFISVILSIRT